jgi:hypothetical protein
MPIDPTISESAVSVNERAVVEKYGFDVRNEQGLFLVVDPVVRKANRGSGGKYGPGGKVELLLTAAVNSRKEYERTAKAPSDEAERRLRRAKSTKAAAAPPSATAATAMSGNGATSSTQNDTSADEHATGVPSDTPSTTAEQAATIEKYGLKVSSGVLTGEVVVEDPKVAKYYAFKDASKKGRYVGTDLDELLAQAVAVHEGMIAPVPAADGKKKAEPKAEKKAKAAEPKPRKDNRYLRAFRVIALDPKVTAEALAKKASMSTSMAAACLQAWQAANAVMAEQKK